MATNEDYASQWANQIATTAKGDPSQYLQYDQAFTTYGQQNQGIETNASNINRNYDTAVSDLESNTQATMDANVAEAASRGLSSSASQQMAYGQTESARRNTANQILDSQQQDSKQNAYYKEQLDNSMRTLLNSNPTLFTQLVTDTTNNIISRATPVSNKDGDFWQVQYGDSPILIDQNQDIANVLGQVLGVTGQTIFGNTYSQDAIDKAVNDIIKSVGY